MELLLITIVVFGVVILIMSLGAILQGKCIKGSCGGEEIWGPDGDLLNCETCPVRQKGDCESHPAA